jgi:hypothetical protein
LRIFGMTYYFSEYEKPMKEFLNRVMNQEREGTSASVTLFRKAFPMISDVIASSFGTRPFHVRGPLNSAVLDAVFSVLLQAKTLPTDLPLRFERLKEDSDFQKTTFYSTSDLSVVKLRFEVAKEYLLR